MKSLLKSLLVCATLLAFAPSAHASLYLEPFLGYLTGKTNGDPKYDVSGVDLGGRVGYSMLGFAVGGEVSRSDLSIDTSPDIDFTPTNLGIFASFEFPILIRAYATYIFSSKGDYNSGGASAEMDEGSGIRLGVGFTGLPFIAINLEYVDLSYDKFKSGGASVGTDFQTKMYGINVSLPLDLL
jgi:hypothetical protein